MHNTICEPPDELPQLPDISGDTDTTAIVADSDDITLDLPDVVLERILAQLDAGDARCADAAPVLWQTQGPSTIRGREGVRRWFSEATRAREVAVQQWHVAHCWPCARPQHSCSPCLRCVTDDASCLVSRRGSQVCWRTGWAVGSCSGYSPHQYAASFDDKRSHQLLGSKSHR